MVFTVRSHPVRKHDTVLVRLLSTGLLLLITVFFPIFVPPVLADIAIDAQAGDLVRGDTVLFSGTVSDSPTIAVFLFVTGPGLPPQGATLENLNLPTGHGHITTAPVLPDGSWQYRWNTANIIGKVVPGEYHVYAVTAPVDRSRIASVTSASITVRIGEPNTPAPIPAGLILPVSAFFLASLIVLPGSRPAGGQYRETVGKDADRSGEY